VYSSSNCADGASIEQQYFANNIGRGVILQAVNRVVQ
jgi:hypothetical protein